MKKMNLITEDSSLLLANIAHTVWKQSENCIEWEKDTELFIFGLNILPMEDRPDLQHVQHEKRIHFFTS